jgi:soluble lytic murein transglycosylase
LEGDRAGAQNLVREAWRYDNFSGDLEAQIMDVFRDLITDANHKTRMDMRLYAEDVDGAMRSANRAGGNAPVIAKARVAVIKKAADARRDLFVCKPATRHRARSSSGSVAWHLSLPAWPPP